MSKHRLHIDFETRSATDLKKSGAHVYAQDPTTDVLCAAYCLDDQEVKLWTLGEPNPKELMEYLSDPNVEVVAHNASFEFQVLNFICARKYNWPSVPITRFDCTMIRAYNMGLPGTLDGASKAVGLKAEKDMKGSRVMLQLSQPRNIETINGKRVITWWQPEDSTPQLDIRAKYEHLYRYCKQDVIVERQLDKRLLPLSDFEKKLWQLDQKINFRGVYCDLGNAKKAIEIVGVEKKRLDLEIRKLTSNEVATCNSAVALRTWINKHDIYKGKKYDSDGPIITRQKNGKTIRVRQYKKDEPMQCQGLGKDQVNDMLEIKGLSKKVKKVLEVRKEAAKSSTTKLNAMILGASSDARIRGCFQYYGAASTGRWAGRRIQLQNMTRPTIKQAQIEKIFEIIENNSPEKALEIIKTLHGPPIARVSDCLRGFLKAAPGKKFIAADFTAIEGRVLAWLAGQESSLNIYRSHGKIYEHTASQIYNVAIDDIGKDDPRRLIGKVATLALGYQGGVGAFQSMAKNYLIKIPDSEADAIKKAWRDKNQITVNYWYSLENASLQAAAHPGQKFYVGPQNRQVCFLQKGSFLFCRLPSGRAICYPYPKIKLVDTPWGEKKNALTYKGEENYKFVTKVSYGGLLAENITQATARDILAEAMFRVEAAKYPVIMHVHDEIVTEVDQGFGSPNELEEIMCKLPNWATDLPINAGGWTGDRYRK